MLNQVLAKVFGSKHERDVKKMTPVIEAVDAFEADFEKLTDDQLRAKTGELKERIAQGASVDDLVAEAFAVVREAARRTIQQRHYPVQLMGGLVLHEGKIAEMKTGEGKTLVATLPVVPERPRGQRRARRDGQRLPGGRDAEWMGQVLDALPGR